MSASSETQDLIDGALARLRRTPAAATGLGQSAWGEAAAPVTGPFLDGLGGDLPAGVALDSAAMPPGVTIGPALGRILVNVILLAASCLPRGGLIRLAGHANDIIVRIEGQGAAWPSGMAACLVDEAAARAALTAQDQALMPLTALLGHAAGIRLSFLLAVGGTGTPPMLRLGG